MVCFPESAATGYAITDPDQYCSVEDTAKIMDRLIQMGRDMKMVLIVGSIENAGGKRPYLSQLITGPEGLIGIYRKTHLSPTESEIYDAGETSVFLFTATGVLVCNSVMRRIFRRSVPKWPFRVLICC
jgi:predicted amidohydrolase